MHEPQTAIREREAQHHVAHAGDVRGVFEQVVEWLPRVVVVLGVGVKRVVGALLALATLVRDEDVKGLAVLYTLACRDICGLFRDVPCETDAPCRRGYSPPHPSIASFPLPRWRQTWER